jgi:choline dehydrogenase-like flavoprotein
MVVHADSDYAKALKLETDTIGGSVTGVLSEVAGTPQRVTADIIVVSCGAANSAALLLRSANDAHPAGLANGSGQVGRNYMFHNSQAVLALSLEPNDTMFQKTLALNDFYFGMDGFPYPMGNIQMIGKSLGGMYVTRLSGSGRSSVVSQKSTAWRAISSSARSGISAVSSRFSARYDREGRLTLHYTPNNVGPLRQLAGLDYAMLFSAGSLAALALAAVALQLVRQPIHATR